MEMKGDVLGDFLDTFEFDDSLFVSIPTIDNEYPSLRCAEPLERTEPAKELPRLLDLQELSNIEKFLDTLAPTDQERRERHVASEHKRRGKIKGELERMVELVGGVGKKSCSQAKLLGMANNCIEELRRENERLKELIRQSEGFRDSKGLIA